ncbi:MAG: acyl-CoA dehydrogenase family protein [Bacteriovoracaceae bacterium]|nr:acyl-CoA dehydrogenase family protein [Bacteriovoracaceae bacterium]
MWFFTSEENELRSVSRDFAQKELGPFAEQHDNAESFNLSAFKKLGSLGLLGITADPEYGGSGLGAVAATLVMEELGKACASTTLSYLAHSILCVNNISKWANAEQKQKYLPKLISGEWIGCMAMSEPEFGSDALGMQTKALEKENAYEISGTKMWITNGPLSHVSFLYARTSEGRKDISSFIVETDDKTSGFSRGKKISKMGMRGSPTGELIFDKVDVPKKNLIGEKNGATYQMMQNLDLERITITGISLGIAQACLEASCKYANERTQFGKSIGKFQMIQKMLADMSAEVEMMRHFLYSSARQYEKGMGTNVLAAQAKLAIPRRATQIALDAIQIHGGYGYSREFPVERYLRDAKLMEIGAGTNEIMVMIIAKSILNLQGKD